MLYLSSLCKTALKPKLFFPTAKPRLFTTPTSKKIEFMDPLRITLPTVTKKTGLKNSISTAPDDTAQKIKELDIPFVVTTPQEGALRFLGAENQFEPPLNKEALKLGLESEKNIKKSSTRPQNKEALKLGLEFEVPNTCLTPPEYALRLLDLNLDE